MVGIARHKNQLPAVKCRFVRGQQWHATAGAREYVAEDTGAVRRTVSDPKLKTVLAVEQNGSYIPVTSNVPGSPDAAPIPLTEPKVGKTPENPLLDPTAADAMHAYVPTATSPAWVLDRKSGDVSPRGLSYGLIGILIGVAVVVVGLILFLVLGDTDEPQPEGESINQPTEVQQVSEQPPKKTLAE